MKTDFTIQYLPIAQQDLEEILTYIEKAETKLPQIDKSNVGNNTPKQIKINN